MAMYLVSFFRALAPLDYWIFESVIDGCLGIFFLDALALKIGLPLRMSDTFLGVLIWCEMAIDTSSMFSIGLSSNFSSPESSLSN